MSSQHHPYSDYLRDIYMEIHSSFYPPPTVFVPNVSIPEPSSVTYQYSFEKERHAIAEYEKEQVRQKAEQAKKAADDASRKSDTPQKTLDSVQNESRPIPNDTRASPSTIKPIWRPEEILTPSRIHHGPTTSRSESVPAPSTGINKPLNGFEEFETITNVFDLMEIRSLDDKAELERLLQWSTPAETPSGLTSSSSQPHIQNAASTGQSPLPYPVLPGYSQTSATTVPNGLPSYSINSTSSVPSSLPSYGSKMM